MITETICPSCKRTVTSSSTYCLYCGNAVPSAVPDAPSGALAGRQGQAGTNGSGKRHVGKLDRVLLVGFGLGKSIAVVMTLVFFLVFLAAGVTLALTAWSTFKTPQFSDTRPNEPSETGGVRTDTSGIKDRQEVERHYGDRLRKILESYSLAANGYDILLGWTIEVPKDRREAFVSGMETFLVDGVAFAKKNGKQPDASELVGQYHSIFSEAVQSEATSKAEALQTRLGLLAVLGVSALLFFIFLIIPALLQIEKNTRPVAVQQ